MDLARLQGMDAEAAHALKNAGIPDAGELAAIDDVDGLAERSGLPRERVEALRDEARARVEQLFERAGIRDPRELLTSDPADIARRTGLTVAALVAYRSHAERHVEREPASSVDRVLLSERSSKARVEVQGRAHEGVAIVTARLNEDDAELLARAGGDAVVLKERAATAAVRVGGETFPALPIFRLREPGEDGPPEMRVRVAEIKDHKAEEPKRGFLARFRRK